MLFRSHLFGSLARAERDPAVRGVFERLAETEARHARFWAARLAAAGHAEPVAVPSRSARFLAWIARCFGPDAILPYLARLERSEEHSSELQSLMRISSAVFCLRKQSYPSP